MKNAARQLKNAIRPIKSPFSQLKRADGEYNGPVCQLKQTIHRLYAIKILRYSLGGGLAALLDLALLYIFTDVFGIYYLYSALLAFACSVTFGYFFQKYITFRDFSRRHRRQSTLFLIFQLAGQALYMALLRLGVDYFGVYYILTAIGAKALVFFWNYFANLYFNFK